MADLDPVASSSSSCRSVSTKDPTTPTSACRDAAMDPPAEPVAVCCLCKVARSPLLALAYQGNLMQACEVCWALHSTVILVARLPEDSAEVRTLADAAMTVYNMATAAVAPAAEIIDP